MPSMTERWEELHRQPRFRPRYPHEQVVRWAFRTIRPLDQGPARVLDFGCGAGRHALFLAAEGFDTHACDISRPAIEALDEIAARRGLSITSQVAQDLSRFEDGYFDAVVSFGVLYYMPYEQAVRTLAETLRILKPGGKFLCVTRTDRDGRMTTATPGEAPFTWRLDQIDPEAPSDAETGMDMLFLPREEVARLFSAFEAVIIDRMTYEHAGFLDDDWVISAQRPAR